jgi:hypothetical protein
MIHYIQENCGLSFEKKIPTHFYKANAGCITQLRGGYIKENRTKHILPKVFFTHEL